MDTNSYHSTGMDTDCYYNTGINTLIYHNSRMDTKVLRNGIDTDTYHSMSKISRIRTEPLNPHDDSASMDTNYLPP